MQWNKFTRLLTCAAFLALTACGESSDNEVSSIIDGSGAPVPDVAVTGAINGFGSVVVDGVHYETNSATIYINGEEASEEELKVGDYITLYAVNDDADGKLNSSIIYAESAVRGVVTSVNFESSTVDVHGRSIRISSDTLFGPEFSEGSILGIGVGDIIEVGGAHDSQGHVYASRIDKLGANKPLLSGEINNLDTGAFQFVIAGVTVDYSQATAQAINDHQWVAVTGSYDVDRRVFMASSIRLRQDREPLPAGVISRIDGIAEDLTESQFTLDGRVVLLKSTTVYINGDRFNLINGSPVFVEGTINEQGAIEATVVRFKIKSFIELIGTVENIELQTVYWYLDTGFLIVDGKKVYVNGSTIVFGRGGDFNRGRAYLFELRLGDKVKVVADAMPRGSDLFAIVIEIDRDITREPPPPLPPR